MGACADGLNKSLQDYIDDSRKANRREVELPSIINTGLEFQTLPKTEQIDDMYADSGDDKKKFDDLCNKFFEQAVSEYFAEN